MFFFFKPIFIILQGLKELCYCEFTVVHLISAEGSNSTYKPALICLFEADMLGSLKRWSLSKSQTHSQWRGMSRSITAALQAELQEVFKVMMTWQSYLSWLLMVATQVLHRKIGTCVQPLIFFKQGQEQGSPLPWSLTRWILAYFKVVLRKVVYL